MKKYKINSLVMFLICFVLAYYLSVFLHEHAHGLMLRIYNFEEFFLGNHYTKWFSLQIDKGVNYNELLAFGYKKEAGYIAVSGVAFSVCLFIISIFILRCKKMANHPYLFYFFYWFALIALTIIFNYLPIRAFSEYGDIGRFDKGLNISPWWIFILGTPFVLLGVWFFFYEISSRAYIVLSLKKNKKLFLFVSAAVFFWGIFSQGFESLRDSTIPLFSLIIAWISLLFPFLIFIIFNPSSNWIKRKIVLLNKKYD